MRVESVIAVPASDAVGPTRLKLLTARTGKLPVVIVVDGASGPEYHVMALVDLQAALTNLLSATPLQQALDLADSTPRSPVAKTDIAAAAVGAPVVEGGRLIGVVLEDKLELPEATEQDFQRGAPSTQGQPAEPDGESGRKRGLWRRLTGSAG